MIKIINILGIIITIIVILLIIYIFTYFNNNINFNMTNYNLLTKRVFRTMKSTNFEWFPCGYTLLSILRFGNSYLTLPDLDIICPEQSIDIMVCANTDKEWEYICSKLKKLFLIGGFKKWKTTTKNDIEKLVIISNKTLFNEKIYINLYRYKFNIQENTIMSSFIDPNYKINYFGYIVNGEGNFVKGIYEDIIVPCPFMYIDFIYRINKYDKYYINKYIKNNTITDYSKNITENVIKAINDKINSITRLGYASLDENIYNKYIYNNDFKKMTCGIAIPCIKKHIKFLPNVLSLFYNQTRRPDDIVISISDVEKDKQLYIKYNLEKIYKDIKIIFHETKKKSWENRDIAVNYLKTDVICLFDSDDSPHKNHIEFIMNFIELGGCNLILCGYSHKNILNNIYNTTDYDIGSDIISRDIQKYNKFDIKIVHFDGYDYHAGAPAMLRDLYIDIGGQTLVVSENEDVKLRNGIGEDIIFIRTILQKMMKDMKDLNKFHILSVPLIYYQPSSSRPDEDQWTSKI